MTYKDEKTKELINVIRNRNGSGESRRFYLLKQEICSKLGNRAWEKMLHKAKVKAVQDEVVDD